MKAKLQRVEIEWLDSATTRGWRRPDDFKVEAGIAYCLTIGYLSRFTKLEVQVVQSRQDLSKEAATEYWGDAISIPRGCIRKIRVLR